MVTVLPDEGRNVWGRIGKGFGQGLSEQIPKEIDRYRLSQGLKQFEQEAGGLTPLQQLTRLSSIPGITPQMVQSFGELAKQQAQAGALSRGVQPSEEKPKTFPKRKSEEKPSEGPQSITKIDPLLATIQGSIPKTYDQILDRAGELFETNPALYKNDPNNAIQAALMEDQQNQAINVAQQNIRKSQQDVQSRVQDELKTQADNAGVEIPNNVYSEIENEALKAVNSGKMTELEAGKHYKNVLDSISRDYKALETIGNWNVLTRTPQGNKDALRSIRKKFKERNDLENLADNYISKNGLSPSKAYYLAYPVSEQKELNNALSKLPPLYKTPSEDPVLETNNISEKIAKLMGSEGSPLAIAEELKAKGYDPQTWMNYVDQNRKKLNLSERQGRELDKPRDFTPSLNDLWMFLFSGLDKLVEQQ